jgi:hypothetical protein
MGDTGIDKALGKISYETRKWVNGFRIVSNGRFLGAIAKL